MSAVFTFSRGFFGVVTAASTTSGGQVLGPRLPYASPAGGAVAAAPAGFVGSTGPTGTGRLIVDTSAGNATWVSLTAGADGQLLEVINNGPNNLTLPAAAFKGVADHLLPPNNRLLIYYDATDVSWECTSP